MIVNSVAKIECDQEDIRTFANTRERLFSKIGAGEPERNVFEEVFIDSKSKRIVGRTTSLSLSNYEFLILWLIIRGQGNPISQSEITFFVYEEHADNNEKDIPLGNSVDVFIVRVRKKLALVTDRVQIITRHGFGYAIVKVQ